jgi:hypothetical protein
LKNCFSIVNQLYKIVELRGVGGRKIDETLVCSRISGNLDLSKDMDMFMVCGPGAMMLMKKKSVANYADIVVKKGGLVLEDLVGGSGQFIQGNSGSSAGSSLSYRTGESSWWNYFTETIFW